jgi:hypothetical protein
MCLDATAADELFLAACTGSATQKWTAETAKPGVYTQGSQCLDIFGSPTCSPVVDRVVTKFACNNGSNQAFDLDDTTGVIKAKCGECLAVREKDGVGPPRTCGSDGSECTPLPTLTYKPPPEPEPEPEPEPTPTPPGPAANGTCELRPNVAPGYKVACNAQKTRAACKVLKDTCRWEPHPHPHPQPGPHSKPVPPPPPPKTHSPWRAFFWTLLVVAAIVLCCGTARFCIQRRRDKESFPSVVRFDVHLRPF